MEQINRMTVGFALFLVLVPAVIHALCRGSYILDPGGDPRTFWIGPISTTLPFAFLAVVFLAHCARWKRAKSNLEVFPKPAYFGASMAWLAMMGLTMFLILQSLGPKTTSTMAIAVFLTPFFYLPFLVVPYAFGSLVARLWRSRDFSTRQTN